MGMDKVAMQRFVRQANGRTPPLEHVLLAAVVLGMGIEVKITPLGQTLGIEPEQRCHRRLGGNRLEQVPLRSRKPHNRSQKQLQILPVQELGLLNVERAQK